METTTRDENPARSFTAEPWLGVVYFDEWAEDPSVILLDIRRIEYKATGDLADAIVGFVAVEQIESRAFRGRKGLAVHRVAVSVAREGYGPLAYEATMHLLKRRHREQLGVLMPGSEVSRSARELWRRFYERADYQHGKGFVAKRSRERRHGLPYLDAWYAPASRSRLAGLDIALANGQGFVGWVMRLGQVSRLKAERQLVTAGYRVFRRAMEDPRHKAVALPTLGLFRGERR